MNELCYLLESIDFQKPVIEIFFYQLNSESRFCTSLKLAKFFLQSSRCYCCWCCFRIFLGRFSCWIMIRSCTLLTEVLLPLCPVRTPSWTLLRNVCESLVIVFLSIGVSGVYKLQVSWDQQDRKMYSKSSSSSTSSGRAKSSPLVVKSVPDWESCISSLLSSTIVSFGGCGFCSSLILALAKISWFWIWWLMEAIHEESNLIVSFCCLC